MKQRYEAEPTTLDPEPPGPQAIVAEGRREEQGAESGAQVLPEPVAARARRMEPEAKQILRLARRLPRRHRLRAQFSALLAGQIGAESVLWLVRILADTRRSRWRERRIATWLLGRLEGPEEECELVNETLRRTLESAPHDQFWPRLERATGRSMLFMLPLALAAAVIPVSSPILVQGSRADSELIRRLITFLLLPFVRFTLSIGVIWIVTAPFVIFGSLLTEAKSNRRRSQLRAEAAESLGLLRDAQSVGALAGALYDRHSAIRRAALPALRQTLPALTTDYFARLAPETVPNLCRLLGHADDSLVLEVLDALGKVGDGRAVQPVARLASRGRTPAIRQAAAGALEVLRERQQRESASHTLLRPSDSVIHPQDQLLRPTDQTGPDDPLTLLRADAAE